MRTPKHSFRNMQWKMLFITMFCYLFFYTGRHNFGWAAHAMAEELHISFEKIGWVSFSMLMGYAVGQFINGNLADHFSPRVMIPLGGLLSVLTNVAISFSYSFPLILILWTCNGYFQSMAWAPGGKLITNWWHKNERGMALGFYTMAAGASSVVTYLLSILLVQQNQHWQVLFRVPVLFLLTALVIFYIIARSKPSDAGYADIIAAAPAGTEDNWKQRYKSVLGNWRFLVACLAIGFQSMARYGLIFWVPIYFLGGNYKSDPHQIWVSLLLPIGMSTGAFSFGFISDRLFSGNRPSSISTGMLLCAVVSMTIFLLPVQTGVAAGILMFLAGFFVYGPQANFWPLCPELLGERYVGTGVGIMNMSAYLFAALGEPVMGKVMDITGRTDVVFLTVAVIALLSSVTIMFTYSAGGKYAGLRRNDYR
ncbi:MFS transporter [Chitinophaga niabensis]|uniref:MFS transporter, OPA family, glycerol-3-phosphate transporter n=1 Tax=Chitinophaga niabensis TaxID=536979 RepID=A0A1N6K8W3_9BACT|nr:MFS transporter [Chitinophaga niabensis]SIO52995.1 MFS transporter, OPA family, glycerol-3-phosphate transporter [Chitinophaga niabensis]